MSAIAKPWYESRGVWGGLVTLICLVLGIFSYQISPEETEQLVLALTGIGTAIGSVLSIYGRVKAKERLR